jgi:hypothetical protein
MKGAGIPPGPCVGRGGMAGVLPGNVGRTGDAGRTAPLPAGGVPADGTAGALRAGVGRGASGADERSAGLGVVNAGGAAAGETGATESGVVIAGVGRADVAGVIGGAIAGVGRAGAMGIIGAAIAGVADAGVAGAIAGVAEAGVAGMCGAGTGAGIVAAILGSSRAATLSDAGGVDDAVPAAGACEPIGVEESGGVTTAAMPEGTVAGRAAAANSSPPRSPGSIVMTAPQTEQRARTLDAGIRTGSTRNTDRHSWQTTFMPCLRPAPRASVRRCASRQRAGYPCGDRLSRPNHPGSWRSSSFPSRVH